MNALKQELEGKLIQVAGYHNPVRATNGFGCHAFTGGQAVFVTDEKTGRSFRVEGRDVLGIVDEDGSAPRTGAEERR